VNKRHRTQHAKSQHDRDDDVAFLGKRAADRARRSHHSEIEGRLADSTTFGYWTLCRAIPCHAGRSLHRRALRQHGSQEFSVEKLLNERPEYFVFNRAVGALSVLHPLQAKVGETSRIARMERGLSGILRIEGAPNPAIHDGKVMPGMGH
jgi:hypothetical protein